MNIKHYLYLLVTFSSYRNEQWCWNISGEGGGGACMLSSGRFGIHYFMPLIKYILHNS